MSLGFEMTDVIAVPEGRIVGHLTAFVRTPFGIQCARIGFAALASGVAATVICALLPTSSNSPAPATVQRPVHTAAAKPAVKPPLPAGFDVAKAWSDEHALLQAATHPEMRDVPADAWSPAGGVSILLATRFPIVTQPGHEAAAADAHQRTAEAETRVKAATNVPLPLSPPAARRNDSRRTAASKAPATDTESQVASLPPQEGEPGYFGFFRKLFEGPDHSAKAMLADNPKTAIYDIEQRVVYLPNGDKLEAHSGYGKWKDDPASFARKNLGVTPPNVYRVTFREKLFHGVRALRLTPVGGGKMYGRDGMLAHSYMLGDGGQSNGCVSVKDYKKFLQAYEDGDFEKLIVVRSVDDTKPSQVASVAPGNV